MATRTYEVTIKLPNGSYEKIQVQATSPQNAKAMIEAQYGKGSVKNGPFQIN